MQDGFGEQELCDWYVYASRTTSYGCPIYAGFAALAVLEHMEADENTPESLPTWVQHEYAHMLQRTCHPESRNNTVYFTNLSAKSSTALRARLPTSSDHAPLLSSSVATTSSVQQMIDAGELPHKQRICLLDPKAEKEISPEDRESFDSFLFGGILGDDPPRDRTKELRKLGFPGRHLGSVQMTTDTAVFVTSLVIDCQTPLSRIPFLDFPTIQFNAQESVEMPFRYVRDPSGEPIMPKGMKQVLYEDMNKGFDDETVENAITPAQHTRGKACVYDKPGNISIKVVEIDTPKPGPGEVLIRMTHSGICHSDFGVMTNSWALLPESTLAGQIGGHEGMHVQT